jgi:hypothetical protein
LVLPALLAVGGGCVVQATPYAPPRDTEIGFDPAMQFGQTCGSELTSWQVTEREDGEQLSGQCSEEIIFTGLVPNRQYTFDIAGFAGKELCWQGSCTVPSEYAVLTMGDCHASVDFLCGH